MDNKSCLQNWVYDTENQNGKRTADLAHRAVREGLFIPLRLVRSNSVDPNKKIEWSKVCLLPSFFFSYLFFLLTGDPRACSYVWTCVRVNLSFVEFLFLNTRLVCTFHETAALQFNLPKLLELD